MLKTLEHYPKTYSAGLLARIALNLENDSNPAAFDFTLEEETIRNEVIDELNKSTQAKTDIERLPQMLAVIEKSLEEYSETENSIEILNTLSEKAELPSDLYKIEVIPNIRDFYGAKYDKEHKLIKETVHNPDKELHFGLSEKRDEPELISIFSKFYKDKFPYNCFDLIVVGQRDKLKINVHQVWRLYPDFIEQKEYSSLIEILKAFANNFGVDIDLDGHIGKFFLTYTKEKRRTFKINLANTVKEYKNKKPYSSVTWSHFTQHKYGSEHQQAFLVLAIDLLKYKDSLKKHNW